MGLGGAGQGVGLRLGPARLSSARQVSDGDGVWLVKDNSIGSWRAVKGSLLSAVFAATTVTPPVSVLKGKGTRGGKGTRAPGAGAVKLEPGAEAAEGVAVKRERRAVRTAVRPEGKGKGGGHGLTGGLSSDYSSSYDFGFGVGGWRRQR